MLLAILNKVQDGIFRALAQVQVHYDLLEGAGVCGGQVLWLIGVFLMEVVSIHKRVNNFRLKFPFSEFPGHNVVFKLFDKDHLSFSTSIILEQPA
jgi:hypothetical protein